MVTASHEQTTVVTSQSICWQIRDSEAKIIATKIRLTDDPDGSKTAFTKQIIYW
jgi:hypothetical protein